MKSILVTLLDNLGDVVMSSAAITLLRDNYPDARIDVLVRAETAEAMKYNPDVNEVLVYPYKSKKKLYKLRETVAAIKKRRYDVSLSFDRRLRAAVVTMLAGIPERIGTHILFRGSKHKLWTRILYTRIVAMNHIDCANVVEMFSAVVRRAFDISGARPVKALPVLPESSAKAEKILAGAIGERLIIGLSVRANGDLKNWPPQNFARLMVRLKEDTNAFLYITGAPSDREYIERLLQLCPKETAVNLAGETSIMDTVALASRSDLFITLDTGTVHVIGHSGVPRIICIFCCTCPDNLLHALPKNTAMLWAGRKCSPCFVPPSECKEHLCSTGISVDMAYDEAVRLLRQPAGSDAVH